MSDHEMSWRRDTVKTSSAWTSYGAGEMRTTATGPMTSQLKAK